MTLYIIGGCSIFIIFILFVSIKVHNKYSNFNIKLEEAENSIEDLLNKKRDFLIRIKPIINKELKSDKLANLDKLDDNINHFELNVRLDDIYRELLSIVDTHDNLLKNEAISNLIGALDDNEDEIDASIKFYNNYVTLYNKLRSAFPSNSIGLMFGFKRKEFYSEEIREMFQILD